MDRDIELTRFVDALHTALAGAEALNLDLLQYLIGLALDETREVVAKNKKGIEFGTTLRQQPEP